ncbi:MAG: hypothetical protein AAB354_09075 [candidate division KSB1 bacterium]
MKLPVIILFSSISSLLPLLSCIMTFKIDGEAFKGFKGLCIFFALAVATEIILHVFTSNNRQSAWVFHVYTFIEYVLITSVLVSWQSKLTKFRLMRVSIPLYIVIFLFIKFSGVEGFDAGLYNNITRPLALLLLTAFALLTLQDLWHNTSKNLAEDYRFWMLLAMALYYSTSLGLFAFMYTKNQELLIALFKIHAVVNIIHNLLFTIGVFKVRAAQQVALEPASAS